MKKDPPSEGLFFMANCLLYKKHSKTAASAFSGVII